MMDKIEDKYLQAAEDGDLSKIAKILRLRPNIVFKNIRDQASRTPIVKATKGGFTSVVKRLIEGNVDVNIPDYIQTTPLHLAAGTHQTSMVSHMVKAGAKLDAKNKDGMIPRDLAHFDSKVWEILYDAECGRAPIYREPLDVPEIPKYAIPAPSLPSGKKKKKKKGSAKKKGRK